MRTNNVGSRLTHVPPELRVAAAVSTCRRRTTTRVRVGELGTSVHASVFGCNTYSYMRSHSAEACVTRLADQGFQEFELMVHPGHLWPADLSAQPRREIRRLIELRGLQLTTLNMPNIDINVAGAAPEMRAYSLGLLVETVRLAGELGASGVVIGPGKANPLFPAAAEDLVGHFFAALDRLCPVAELAGTALWVENMPFAFLPALGELVDALKTYGNDAVRIVYDVANAHFIGEDFVAGLGQCGERLALVHLSDTGQRTYRHDPVGEGTVPFAVVPRRARRGRPSCAANAGDHLARPRSRHRGERRQARRDGVRAVMSAAVETIHDVVVVGGGASGLAAAIEARALGRDVVLVEKNPQLGGSTAWSIGSVSASATPHQLRKGIKDRPEDHWRDMAGFNGDLDPRDNPDLRRVLADAMPDTFRWLLAHGVRFYGPMPEPPHKKPRMHNVLPNSRAFITHLGKAARRAGVAIACGARAAELVVEDGRVVAIDCAAPDGTRRFRARGGIVLASGDFTSDPELKAQFMGPQEAKIDGVNVTATGDGQKLALRLGARIINGDLALGPELPLRAAAAAQHPVEPAAVARTGEPDGVVARAHAERAAAAVRDELRDDRAGAVAELVRRGRDPDQPARRALY